MQIYYKVENKKISEISDISKDEDWKNIEVDTQEILEKEFQERNLKFEADKFEDELSSFFPEDDNELKIEEYKITHRVINRSFGELVEMYEGEEIYIPNMQRNYIWTSTQASRLIESIILGLPIPPLFFLDAGDNKYEIIDGVQRLTTVVNFIKGRSWNYSPKNNTTKISRLSNVVAEEIKGKSFKDLEKDAPSYARKIIRDTVPIIEFSQSSPENTESKYLIFERINTGSAKLNEMQIRKSLAHGKFMDKLYDFCNKEENLKKLFTNDAIKKDKHIEAFLRVYVMSKVFYGEFDTKGKQGIKDILNLFCEENKDNVISDEFMKDFSSSLEKILGNGWFDENSIFKRYKEVNNNFETTGNLNVATMESILGVFIREKSKISIEPEKFKENYKKILAEYSSKPNQADNPFSVGTGKISAIELRFREAKKIFGIS
jgi:hypothetical protein